MYILAFDTCCGICSVAVTKNQEVLSYLSETELHQQSEKLVPMIEECLNQAKLSYKDLDYIAVTVGPGSFTGVRIGLAAAQGISISSGVKVIGITTLEAIAAKETGDVMATLDAGREQFYAQEFSSGNPIEKPRIISELPKDKKMINELPDAKEIALVAYRKLQDPEFKIEKPQPLYIRQPDAVEKKLKA